MRLTKWLKTVFFRKKEACLENQKSIYRAWNQSQPHGSRAMNTFSKFQLDALGLCRDTGVTKSCFSRVVNFSALSIISIKTDWYTLFRCGFRQKAWKTCLYHRCEYELDLTWSVEHVSVHSVVAYMQWLLIIPLWHWKVSHRDQRNFSPRLCEFQRYGTRNRSQMKKSTVRVQISGRVCQIFFGQHKN